MGVLATKNLVPIPPLGSDGLAPKPCHIRQQVGQVVVLASPKCKALRPDLEKLSDLIGSNLKSSSWPSIQSNIVDLRAGLYLEWLTQYWRRSQVGSP